MTDDEFRLLKDFHKPNSELQLRDRVCYGSNVTVLRNGHYCTQCRKRIPEGDPAGLNIVITDRDEEFGLGPKGMEREFCDWDCVTDWFEVQAGRRAYRP